MACMNQQRFSRRSMHHQLRLCPSWCLNAKGCISCTKQCIRLTLVFRHHLRRRMHGYAVISVLGTCSCRHDQCFWLECCQLLLFASFCCPMPMNTWWQMLCFSFAKDGISPSKEKGRRQQADRAGKIAVLVLDAKLRRRCACRKFLPMAPSVLVRLFFVFASTWCARRKLHESQQICE